MNAFDIAAAADFFHITLNPWKFVGLAGSLIFGLRFVIQWIASERAKKSVIPIGFWECSALGSILTLSYFAIYRHDSVGILQTALPVADLLAQFILPLDASSCATSGERTAPAGIAAAAGLKRRFYPCRPSRSHLSR